MIKLNLNNKWSLYRIIILEHGCPATFSARIQPLPDPADSEEDLYQDSYQIAEGGRSGQLSRK